MDRKQMWRSKNSKDSPEEKHIVLFHFAITGLVLDHLTVPLDDGFDPSTAIDLLADGFLPEQLAE